MPPLSELDDEPEPERFCSHQNHRAAGRERSSFSRVPAAELRVCTDCGTLFRQLPPAETAALMARTRVFSLEYLAVRVEAHAIARRREREHCERHGLELVPINDHERATFARLSRAVAALLNQ